jgi:hypothetical protein
MQFLKAKLLKVTATSIVQYKSEWIMSLWGMKFHALVLATFFNLSFSVLWRGNDT